MKDINFIIKMKALIIVVFIFFAGNSLEAQRNFNVSNNNFTSNKYVNKIIKSINVNNDGFSDLLLYEFSGSFGLGSFMIKLGDAQASFNQSTSFSLGSSSLVALDIKTGNLNNDLFEDLIILYSNKMDIYLNNQNGGYSNPASYSILGGLSIEVGDINSDNNQDLILLTNGGSLIINYLGNGAGVFNNSASMAVQGNDMKIVDINGDLKLDLLLTKAATDLSVYYGTGFGTFVNEQIYLTGEKVLDFAAIDIDNNGIKDIVYNTNSKISILLFGLNSSTHIQEDYILNSPISEMKFGDVNGDQKIDIICNSYQNHGISVLHRFSANSYIIRNFSSRNQVLYPFEVSDFNNDGFSDFVTGYYTGINVPSCLTFTGLIANYDFNQYSYDISGNNNSPLVLPSQSFYTADKDGLLNSALQFSGNNLLPINNTLGNFGTGDFAFSFWFNSSDIGSINRFLSKRQSDSRDNYFSINLIGGKLYLETSENGNKYYDIQGTTTVIPNTWYHVVAQRKNNKLALYLNSVEEQTNIVAGSLQSININNNFDFVLGNARLSNGSAFNQGLKGKLDNARIYNRALKDCEINQLFDCANTCPIEKDFITIWSTSNFSNSITFKANTSGNVNYTWETVPTGQSGSGTFNSANGFNVVIPNLPMNTKIKLSISPANFNQFQTDGSYAFMLIDVAQWGTTRWNNMNEMFANATRMNISATDTPILTDVRDMSLMFGSSSALSSSTNINTWDVSNVTNMSGMFSFNSFNQNISNWNVGNVEDMSNMFSYGAFNQPIGGWDVGKVKNMSAMFSNNLAFNQPIGLWDVRNVINMNSMFESCVEFNQPLNNWNVRNVQDMSMMFKTIPSIGKKRSKFNQPLDNWEVINVTNMQFMFDYSEFNQPLNNWDVSNVIDMSFMFRYSEFNQPINNWRVNNVIDMQHMFSSSSLFNQSLFDWGARLNTNVNLQYFMYFSGLSVCNYDATLQGFANGGVKDKDFGYFGASGLTFSNTTARATLLSNGWSIQGDRQGISPISFDLPSAISSSTLPLNPSPSGGTFTFTPALGVSIANGVLNINSSLFTGNTLSVTYATSDGCTTTKTATVNLSVNSDEFITEWNLATPGSSPTAISFGVATNGQPVSYTWESISPAGLSGSGTFNGSVANITGLPANATIRLKIAPTNFRKIFFYNGSGIPLVDHIRLTNIAQWGTTAWSSMSTAFWGCENLQVSATDVPNLTNVASMTYMFNNCKVLNSPTNIGSWNTSSVTNMEYLFAGASAFNQNIGGWNTANVTSMAAMFDGATVFNQNIGTWNTSNVQKMNQVFFNAKAFNQDIGGWNTSKVNDMYAMFYNAEVFNQNIVGWDVSKVTNLALMFHNAKEFNQPIGSWNTESATETRGMFAFASKFNSDINTWNTSNVTNMSAMFQSASVFNKPVGAWNTSKVIDMSKMFFAATEFNQSIEYNATLAPNSWNTSNVTNMSEMFARTAKFNQPIGSWSTLKVTDMRSMFEQNPIFNQDISNWQIDNVTNTSSMFYLTKKFNQDLSSWKINNVTNMSNMFSRATEFNKSLASWGAKLNTNVNLIGFLDFSGLSISNYEATLQGFSTSVPNGRTMGATGLKYCDPSVARNALVSQATGGKGWTINGDIPIKSDFTLTQNICPTLNCAALSFPLSPVAVGGSFTHSNVAGISIANNILSINYPLVNTSNLDVTYTNQGCSTTKSTIINLAPPPPALCVPTTNLKGYYAFLRNAKDASGNNVNGVVTGATQISDRFGVPNSAYSFSGGTQAQPHYIELSPTQAQKVSGDKLTISTWVKITGNGYNWGRIFLGGQVNEQYTITKVDGADDRILFRPVIDGQSLNYGEVYSNTALSRNIWHHVLVQYDGTKSSIYINGRLDNSTQGVTGNLKYNAKTSVIGGETVAHEGSFTASVFDGSIDDLVIFDRVLSECEIKQMYDCNVECTDCATTNGLKAYFPLNGNAYDLSGNGFHGTIQSGVANGIGRKNFDNGSLSFAGGAANFQGTGVLVNHNPALNFNTSYSFNLWFKYNANNNYDYQMLFSKGRDINNSYWLSLQPSTGKLRFYHNNGNGTVYDVEGILNNFNATWKNISGVLDRKTNSMYLYVDGQLIAKKTYTNLNNVMTSTNPLSIGFHEGDAGIRYPVNGLLDDVRFYDKALSPCDVNNLYSCTKSCPVASYPFCSDVKDVSGNDINLSATNVFYSKDKFLNDNSAIKISNNGFLASSDPLLNFKNGSIAVSVWIKSGIQTGERRILSKGHSGWSNGYLLGLNWQNQGTISFGVGGGSDATSTLFNTTNRYDDNLWHHVVAIHDVIAKKSYLIVDGAKQSIEKYPSSGGEIISNELDFTNVFSNLLASSNDDFLVGKSPLNAEYFDGEIDGIKIYDKALSQTEITALFNEPAPCPGPVSAYNFCGNIYENSNLSIPIVQGFFNLEKDRFNYPNSAVKFSGNNSFSNINFSNTDLLDAHTFSFWIKAPAVNATLISSGIISNSNNSSAPFSIDLTNENKIKYFFNDENPASTLISNTILQADTWYHVVATWDKFEMKILINNSLDNSKAFAGVVQSPINDFNVGLRKNIANGYLTNAVLDDIAIYKRAISAAEINNLYSESTACIRLKTDIVADYPICSNFDDVSGNDNALTNISGSYTIDRQNNFGSAISIPQAKLTGTKKSNLDFDRSSFTLSTWFKLDDASTGAQYFLSNGNTGLSQGYFLGSSVYSNAKNICFGLGASSASSSVAIMTNNTYGDGQWHHVSVIVDRVNGKISIYVDGNKQPISKASAGGRPPVNTYGVITPQNDLEISSGTFLIASSQSDFMINPNGNFKGGLDEIKIYNNALSLSDISLLNNAKSSCSSPIAAYPFCGNSLDASGNNYNGIVNGATLASDRFGITNSAYSFDGVDDRIQISGFPNTQDLSVSYWFKVPANSGSSNNTYPQIAEFYDNVADNNQTSSSFAIGNYIRPAINSIPNNIYGIVNNQTGSQTNNFSADIYTVDTWYHVVNTYNRTTGLTEIYVNGTKVNSATATQPMRNINSLVIGAAHGTDIANHFSGLIDDIKIYDRVLNANEILALGDCNKTIAVPIVTRNNNRLSTPSLPNKKYQWYKNDLPIANATSSFYDMIAEASISKYKVMVSNIQSECSCGISSSDVCIFPAPSLVITNPAAVCSPLAVDITTTWVDAANYSANGSCASGVSVPVVTYWTNAQATQALANPSAVAIAGTYYIKIQTPFGTDIKPVIVTINQLPTFMLTNPNPTCVTSPVNLANQISGGSFSDGSFQAFNVNPETNPTATPLASTIVNQIGTNTYFIKRTNICGSLVKSTPVTIYPLPSEHNVSSVKDKYCKGTNVDFISTFTTADATSLILVVNDVAQSPVNVTLGTLQNTLSYTFVNSGNYNVKVIARNQFGCTRVSTNILSIEIGGPNVAVVSTQPISCYSQSDGNVKFKITNEFLSGYVNGFNWNIVGTNKTGTNSSGDVEVPNMPFGNYRINVVQQTTGCTASTALNIGYGGPVVSNACIPKVLCTSQNYNTDFKFTITAQHPIYVGRTFTARLASPNGTIYSSATSNFGTQFSIPVANPEVGEYKLSIAQVTGGITCNDLDYRVITEPLKPILSTDKPVLAKCPSDGGTIVAKVNLDFELTCGQNAPSGNFQYTSQFTPTGGVPRTGVSGMLTKGENDISIDSPDEGGVTVITLTSPEGYCVSEPLSIKVEPLRFFSASISKTEPLCYNTPNGKISTLVIGGSGQLTYEWFKDNVKINEFGSEISNQGAGDYKVIITDLASAAICSDLKTLTTTLTAPTQIIKPSKPIQSVLDGNKQCKISSLTEGGGTPNYKFHWYYTHETTRQTFAPKTGENIAGTPYVKESTTTEVYVDHDISFNENSELNPTKVKVELGKYYVVVEDANGCLSEPSLETELESPLLERNYPLCFAWTTKPDPKEKPADITNTIQEGLKSSVTIIAQEFSKEESKCISAAIEQVKGDFSQYCSNVDLVKDEVSIEYNMGIHKQFTLYYYDRAGRLLQTVPPQGVRLVKPPVGQPLTRTSTTHKLKTTYTYNSLGELISQNTPDGGTSAFVYNRRGQLRFSQNARQLAVNKYSYTKYDELNRIAEVGEDDGNITGLQPQITNETEANSTPGSLPVAGSLTTKEKTTTVYTQANTEGITYLGNAQRNLLNRVSYTTTENLIGGVKSATYYSYDVHGNVEWLIQDIPTVGKNTIEYEYDLISGKVLSVVFNKTKPNQFYHRYSYDEDNRITAVETSRDNVIWDKDASYDYYSHGPLKRVSLGHDKVQGIDYTYTLQGWLKGINTAALQPSIDPGKDGATGGSGFEKDVFGMELGYFQGDFVKPGSPFHSTATSKTGDAGVLPIDNATASASKNLYNGNIAAWASNMNVSTSMEYNNVPTAFSYSYDKLNRLKSNTMYVGNASDQFLAESNSPYSENMTYDKNGNILTLKRTGRAQALNEFDDLTYEYDTDISNRLNSVTDQSTSAMNTKLNDISGTSNYTYDAIGNLISDSKERINIRWNVYGKIAEIVPYTPLEGIKDKPHMIFYYDASGNRIAKQVNRKPYLTTTGSTPPTAVTISDPSQVTTTYYVRDASGNVMHVYERSDEFLKQINAEQSIYKTVLKANETPIYGSDRLGMYKPEQVLLEKYYTIDRNVTFDYANLSLQLMDDSRVAGLNAFRTILTQGINNASRNKFSVVDINTKTNATTPVANLSNLTGINSGILEVENKEGLRMFSAQVSRSSAAANIPYTLKIYNKYGILMKGNANATVDPNAKLLAIKDFSMPGNQYYLLFRTTTGLYKYFTINPDATGYGTASVPAGEVVGTASDIYAAALGRNPVAIEDYINKKSYIYFTTYSTGSSIILRFQTKDVAGIENSNLAYAPNYTTTDVNGDGQMAVSPDGKTLSVYVLGKNIGALAIKNASINTYNLLADYTLENTTPVQTNIAGGVLGKASLAYDKYMPTIYYRKRNTNTASNDVFGKSVASTSEVGAPILTNILNDIALSRNSNYDVYGLTNNAFKYMDAKFNTGAINLTATTMKYSGLLSSAPLRIYKQDQNAFVTTRKVGDKEYELKDHLGNVRVVLGDNVYKSTNDLPAIGTETLVSESFETLGVAQGLNGGTGWQNTNTDNLKNAWWRQNDYAVNYPVAEDDYHVSNVLPLSYGTLRTNGGYLRGGTSYLTVGRTLDVSPTGPLAANLLAKTDQYGNTVYSVGQGNLWMSFLIRKETSDNDEVAVKLAESDIAWNAQNTGIEIGYFGDIYSMENGVKQWTLKYYGEVTTPRGGKIYTTLYKNLGPMIVGQTALVVLNIEFFGAPIPTDPSYRPAAVTALLNPNANTLGKTITLNQSDRVFVISKQFRNIVFYGGNTKAKGSMDEFRIGNSYAAVTPTTTDNRVDIRYAANYYPFGSPMPGRSFTAGLAYRYGFNGKEKDPEFQNNYDYGFRIYNPALGKFLSVDPLSKSYPMLTSYQFASNTPIMAIDLDGLEAVVIISQKSRDGFKQTFMTLNETDTEISTVNQMRSEYPSIPDGGSDVVNILVDDKGNYLNTLITPSVDIEDWTLSSKTVSTLNKMEQLRLKLYGSSTPTAGIGSSLKIGAYGYSGTLKVETYSTSENSIGLNIGVDVKKSTNLKLSSGGEFSGSGGDGPVFEFTPLYVYGTNNKITNGTYNKISFEQETSATVGLGTFGAKFDQSYDLKSGYSTFKLGVNRGFDLQKKETKDQSKNSIQGGGAVKWSFGVRTPEVNTPGGN